jgi:3-oxoacyl-[acyl-carrier-protein] synthase II
LGVVASNGIGKAKFADALLSGHSGIARISSHDDSDLPCQVIARITGFDVSPYLDRRDRYRERSMSRVSQFAVASAQMALQDADLDPTKLDPVRTGICYGTTTGKPDFDDDAARFSQSGVAGLDPSAWAEFSPHAPAAHIARELGFSGPVATTSAGCCTGLLVMDWGAERIATGRLDTVLVGSGDSLLSPLVLGAFGAGKLLTKQSEVKKASRPYDLQRDGLVPGEAAGAIVLETLEAALERNAQIYAEYLGYGSAVDSNRPGERDRNGQGLARAVKTALWNANLGAGEIDCINSHGLSHPIFDLLETQGFKTALGDAAYSLSITSIKPLTGATFAGDGILQAISSCLILKRGVIPAIPDLETPDPACDLDYVVKKPRTARVRHILTNTRALGGANAVVILGRLNGKT